MPGDKKTNIERQEKSERQLDELMREAMVCLGWLIPTTPEAVARAEAELDEESIELPESLQDPYVLLDATVRPRSTTPVRQPSNDDIVQCLARAAREGKDIPAEVEEQMRKDRERAERNASEGKR
jgi:hypothetical protein